MYPNGFWKERFSTELQPAIVFVPVRIWEIRYFCKIATKSTKSNISKPYILEVHISEHTWSNMLTFSRVFAAACNWNIWKLAQLISSSLFTSTPNFVKFHFKLAEYRQFFWYILYNLSSRRPVYSFYEVSLQVRGTIYSGMQTREIKRSVVC